ncbi:hypothetical protein BG000_006542, partial [Podila horticola]
SLIAQYLSPKDIITCIHVSRAYKALFTPLLWRSFPLEALDIDNKFLAPLYFWNAHSIRYISVTADALAKGLSPRHYNLLREYHN